MEKTVSDDKEPDYSEWESMTAAQRRAKFRMMEAELDALSKPENLNASEKPVKEGPK